VVSARLAVDARARRRRPASIALDAVLLLARGVAPGDAVGL
jgi:hypothetical protein